MKTNPAPCVIHGMTNCPRFDRLVNDGVRLRGAIKSLAAAHEAYRTPDGSVGYTMVRASPPIRDAWREAFDALEDTGDALEDTGDAPATPSEAVSPPSMNKPEPPPSHARSAHPACWDLVLCHPSLANEALIPLRKDMEERDRQGAEKYGVRLHPFNGRSAVVDLYQELLDACVYGMQALYERRAECKKLRDEHPRADKAIEHADAAVRQLERVVELVITVLKNLDGAMDR